MANEIEKAIETICEEKGISREAVISTIEAALAAAYRKDFAEKNQNIKVTFDSKTGGSEVFDVKTVVEDLPEEENGESSEEKKAELDVSSDDEGEKRKFNPKTEIQLSSAKQLKPNAVIGDEIVTQLVVPEAYGRMAAQTAKQVIIQKLREAEREMQFSEFQGKAGTVVTGTVQRRDARNVLVDIGRVTARMPREEQIERENYRTGDRIKIYILSVTMTTRGPDVVVSRASDEIVRAVFKNEIPEIANGIIEIKAVAREPGSRAKVAVFTADPNIDPIGSCVGQRGTRVQTIISELGGEKIDIIQHDDDPSEYIRHALSPAKLTNVEVDRERKTATVTVDGDQLSLAIGRSGQNVRLASKLTGYSINLTSGESGAVVIPEDDGESIPAATNGVDAKTSDKKEAPDKEEESKTP